MSKLQAKDLTRADEILICTMNEAKGQKSEGVGEEEMESLNGVRIVQATDPVITRRDVLRRVYEKA